MARPFPVANEVFGYVLYFLLVHRAGYHFSSHVPLAKALGVNDGPPQSSGMFCAALPFIDECDGFYDWTAFLEHALCRLIDEQRYIMDKLDGMARRRERFRSIPFIDECDGFYDWTAFLEHALCRLIDEQRYIMDKLDGMARRRERFRSIIFSDVTMNSRQQDVFLEAMLPSWTSWTAWRGVASGSGASSFPMSP